MLRHREAIAFGLIALAGALAGCDADPFHNMGASDGEAFMAVGVSGVGGADGTLNAKAHAVASESATVSLPEDILDDVPDEAFLAVDAAEIAVVINGDVNGRAKSAAKAQEHHAAITFRLARDNRNACDALDQVGPFELTITDGVVTLAEDLLPLGAGARSIVRNGRFEMCAETWADFDGSISVGQMSFEFGRLRGNAERVVLCHVPPGNPDNEHTITVGSSATETHLAHGDYLGECEEQDENPLDDNGDDEAGEDSNSDDDNGDPDEDEEGGADDEEDGDDDSGDDADDAGGDDNGDDDRDDADDDGADDESEDGDDESDVDDDDADEGDGDGETSDSDGGGIPDGSDACPDTTSGASVDADGCSTNQLTRTATVPGPTDIYLAGQPDSATANWPYQEGDWTSVAPDHSPVMIDVSAWAGKELRFTATGTVITGGNNAAAPDGRNCVLRPNGLSQVFGLTAMTDYREGALIGVFLKPKFPGLAGGFCV